MVPIGSAEYAAVDKIARAICREQCAHHGEPPCFEMRDDKNRPMPWPNPNCNEPGCFALAMAAYVVK